MEQSTEEGSQWTPDASLSAWVKYQVPWEAACDSAYLGLPIDKRARGERSVTLWLPQEFLKTVDDLLNAAEDFGGKRENFFKFAILATTLTLAQNGSPPNALPTSLAWIKQYHQAAAEERQRRDMLEASETFDMMLTDAMSAGDWEAIDEHLTFLDHWLEGCSTDATRKRAERVIADRRGLANAVAWMSTLTYLPSETVSRVERWGHWFEGWGAHLR